MFDLGKFKDRYAFTDKVIAQVFEHRYLGKIDLSQINEVMAEKLVITGHLKKASKPIKKSKG